MDAKTLQNQIKAANYSGFTVDQLKGMVSGLSVDLPSGTKALLLYNGEIEGVGLYRGVESLIAHDSNLIDSPTNPNTKVGQFGWIQDTQAAKLAGSFEFRSAMENALRGTVPDPQLNSRVNAVINGAGTTKGIFDDISSRMVSGFGGDIYPVARESGLDKVFTRSEISAYLDSSSNGKMFGVEKNVWKEFDASLKGDRVAFAEHMKLMTNEAFRSGEFEFRSDGGTKASLVIKGTTLQKWGLGSGSAIGDFGLGEKIDPSKFVSKIDDLSLRRLDTVSDFLTLKLGLKVGATLGQALGPIGDILEAASWISKAKDAHNAHDDDAAARLIAEGAGSLLGGYGGAAFGAAFATGLALSGPVGWATAAALIIMGSAVGGGYGQGFAGIIYDWLSKDGLSIIDSVGKRFSDTIQQQLRRLLDPIVIDMEGNGVDLIARSQSGVYFDMDGDGIKELTGWVGKSDGLLAIDENANGKIDGIKELIGDQNRSGFGELVTYNLNGDNVIDGKDAIFSKLRVWVDANSNGMTDAGELLTMAQAKIKSIDVRFTTVNFTAEGNKIHEKSNIEWTDGRASGLVVDAWFDVSNVTTDSVSGTVGNATIDALPDIRGYGDVKSLRSAMLADGALTSLVTDVDTRRLDQLDGVRDVVEQIIYRWTKTQGIIRLRAAQRSTGASWPRWK